MEGFSKIVGLLLMKNSMLYQIWKEFSMHDNFLGDDKLRFGWNTHRTMRISAYISALRKVLTSVVEIRQKPDCCDYPRGQPVHSWRSAIVGVNDLQIFFTRTGACFLLIFNFSEISGKVNRAKYKL